MRSLFTSVVLSCLVCLGTGCGVGSAPSEDASGGIDRATASNSSEAAPQELADRNLRYREKHRSVDLSGDDAADDGASEGDYDGDDAGSDDAAPAAAETPDVAEHRTPPAPAVNQPRPDDGVGPGSAGDRFEHIVENRFLRVTDSPLSTFSIDVDTASYSKSRMYLMQYNRLPPPDAVRIEELINYFSYDYASPKDDHPFAAHVEVAECPWQPQHRLVRVGIKGKEVNQDQRQASNLVFLIDRSGSMRPENKLPLVKHGMQMLVEQLDERDVVTIVAYASGVATILPATPGSDWEVISDAIDQLQAGGATAGGAGLEVAYHAAQQNFIPGGINRVVLCTDGDFNIGRTSPGELVRQVEAEAKKNIFMSVLAFGMGNHNDYMLEQISNKGNGNYAFVDTQQEARKVLVDQMSGTLVTIAKDVKIQIEFNPSAVEGYRLIGYENRKLADEDFNDDKKDAGEIGAGHRVTALYEIVPVGSGSGSADLPGVDPLKYQREVKLSEAAQSGELLTLKLRYKQPEGDKSTLMTIVVEDQAKRFGEATQDFKFTSAVASFAMLLRNSQFKGNATYDAVLEIATAAKGSDEYGYRTEFLSLIKRARDLRR